jgi:hypothetical protein
MPKAGVTSDRSRREKAVALEESKRPKEGGSGRSVLAQLLRQPNANTKRALVRAASNGELTTHDLQAGVAALIADARDLLPSGKAGRKHATPEAARAAAAEAEQKRSVFVLLKQLMEGLKDVVLSAPSSGGPTVVVELHWPDAYAGVDAGEAVRTKVPEGMEVM